MLGFLRLCGLALLLATLVPGLYAQTPAGALSESQKLLSAHDLDGAWDVLNKAAQSNPESSHYAELLASVDYLRGELGDAEMEFKRALRLNDKYARAWLGLGRVFEAGSLRAKAKICYEKAYAEAPADPEIQRYYFRTLSSAQRLASLEKQPVTDSDSRDSVRGQLEELKRTGGRTPFGVSFLSHIEIKLSLLNEQQRIRGYALPVSINGGKTFHLLMDTGASGILLNRRAVEAAGLPIISDVKFGGLGDEGERSGQVAFADRVQVGGVALTDCPIVVSERKFLTDEDGIVGLDIFSQFLVTINLQRALLTLDPLPAHKAAGTDSAWQDREIAPEFAGYSTFWRSGHEILLPVRANDSRPVLFLIDTGSSNSLIDPAFAHRFSALRHEDAISVRGISGKVEKVQTADALIFEFAHYRQRMPGVLAVQLGKIGGNSPKLSGIFGLNTLVNFRLQINYRDGLINMDYVGPKY